MNQEALHPTITTALIMAVKAHDGHRRKYTGEPYVNHPIRVASILQKKAPKYASVRMIAAALLHDVAEDTPVTVRDIEDVFGPDIASLVDGMTDKTTLSDGNRETRRRMDRERMSKCDGLVQTLKYCDIYDNVSDILVHDRSFARTYLREKLQILEVMTDGDHDMREEVLTLVREGLVSLTSSGEA